MITKKINLFANDRIVAVQRVLTDMAVARTKTAVHESYSSAAVAADPIVGIDRLLSEVAATHVVFHDPPASPEPPHTEYGCSSALQDSAEVVLDIATTSDRPLTIVVLEDDDDTPPPPPPPQPQQADDVSVMRAAYELKADRVRYINTDLKMMKVAYTRRWVAATTKSLPAKQSASDWTWACTSTSSEMSASSSLQAGIAATIARQVRGRLTGRTVSRYDVITQPWVPMRVRCGPSRPLVDMDPCEATSQYMNLKNTTLQQKHLMPFLIITVVGLTIYLCHCKRCTSYISDKERTVYWEHCDENNQCQ